MCENKKNKRIRTNGREEGERKRGWAKGGTMAVEVCRWWWHVNDSSRQR